MNSHAYVAALLALTLACAGRAQVVGGGDGPTLPPGTGDGAPPGDEAGSNTGGGDIGEPGGGDGRVPWLPVRESQGTQVCPADRYVVNVPQWEARAPGEDFGARLAERMTELLRTRGVEQGWVCRTPADCARADHQEVARLRARVASTLPPRDGVRERADGHRRFWRLAFYRVATPGEDPGPGLALPPGIGQLPADTRLGVRTEMACDVVETLRREAEALAPGAVHISRECLASTMARPGYEAVPDWHLQRIGARKAAPGVRISLIDTGLSEAVADALGVERRWSAAETLPDLLLDGEPPPEIPDRHRHSGALGIVIRQLTKAPLDDLRTLDPDGRGPIGLVAAAIDEAVFGHDEPQVINLSLGWPPELERVRRLEGTRCETTEDPVGESVRHALQLAAARDRGTLTDARGRRVAAIPTLVVAAAGNRPPFVPRRADFYAERFQTVDGEVGDPCGEPGTDDLFYPGEWARRATCPRVNRGAVVGPVRVGLDVLNRRRGAPLVLAVDATDPADRRSGFAAAVPETALVAPGENVWVNHPAIGADDALGCDEAPADGSLALPAAFSGSSLGAALVSGAAAPTIRALLSRGQSADAAGVARVLYLSGAPVGRGDTRRLDVERLNRLLNCRHLPALSRVCASREEGLAGGPPNAGCRRLLQRCGLDERPAEPLEVTWPFHADPEACTTLEDPNRRVDDENCRGDACPPYLSEPDRFSAGGAGPQPEDNGCAECGARFDGGSQSGLMTLTMHLNPALPEGTSFDDPYVKVLYGNGRSETIPLDDLTEASDWHPGALIKVLDIKLKRTPSDDVALDQNWLNGKVYLVTQLRTPSQSSATSDVAVFEQTLE